MHKMLQLPKKHAEHSNIATAKCDERTNKHAFAKNSQTLKLKRIFNNALNSCNTFNPHW